MFRATLLWDCQRHKWRSAAVVPRQNHGNEIPIPTSNEKALRWRITIIQVERQNEATTGFGTQFMDLFYFPSSSIAQQGAAFQRATGMHGMPLDAAASICLDAAPNCIFRRIKFLLTATFVGLHRWGDVLRM